MAEEITDRLKAEGQLIRNTGTNSIRAVRIQLDRFENVFETISEQVTLQTQFLSSMAQISESQFKLNEETRERESERRARESLSEDQKKEATEEKSSRKISLASLIPDDGSGFMSTLLRNAMFAGGAFALGNIFKGFLEERIGETEFSDSLISAISWGAVGTLFGKKIGLLFATGSLVSDALGLPNVIEKIGKAFNLEFAENDLITSGIGTALASGLALAISKKGGLRGKLLVGIATAMVLFGDQAKNWLENLGMPEDWADQTVETTSTIANFATVGMMFGPKGALIGAAVGLAYSLGKGIYDWFNKQELEAEEQLKKDLAEAEKILQDKKQRSEIESFKDELKVMTPEKQEIAIKERGGLSRPEQLAFEKIATPEDYDTSEITYILSEIKRFNQMGAPVPSIFVNDLKELGYNMDNLRNDTGYELPEFKRGTKGFQDFGPASFAILHGKEAVVPEETPAGRFLNQFFNKDWTPKMAETSSRSNTLSTVSSGASSNVIINNAPTIAPNVNNVGGSTSVNNTNLVGTGGGSNNIDPYGMPRAAN